jgi:hypothetical protein
MQRLRIVLRQRTTDGDDDGRRAPRHGNSSPDPGEQKIGQMCQLYTTPNTHDKVCGMKSSRADGMTDWK